MTDNFDYVIQLLFKKQQEEFEKAHENMPEPKYKKYDIVSFNFSSDADSIDGMIAIIDKYGTFEQNEEPSYDIYRFENNTLYKHVRESSVIRFIRKGTEEEIKKFGW